MRIFMLVLLGVLWLAMLIKTIFVSMAQEDSFFVPYYGGMMGNDWQSHFNFDLLIHSLIFSFWIMWRERSKAWGFILGLFAILFGAVFSFVYLWIAIWRNGENPMNWFVAK